MISEVDIVNGTVIVIGEAGFDTKSPVVLGGMGNGSKLLVDCRPSGDFCLLTGESKLRSGDVNILSQGKRLFQGAATDEGSSLYAAYSVASEKESITGNSYLQIGTLEGASGQSIVITKVGGSYRKQVIFPEEAVGLLLGLAGAGDYRLALQNGGVAVVHDGAEVYSVGAGVTYFAHAESGGANSGLSGGEIAGIVIGGVLLIVAVVVIWIFVIRPRLADRPGVHPYQSLDTK
jgi:hypothetical protein